jgi:hypothetical protein
MKVEMTIRRPGLFQVWMLISALWLVVASGIAVKNWPGEDYAKPDLFPPQPFGEEASNEWRDQHPECKDTYGFWPDGQRMDRSQFEVADGRWLVLDPHLFDDVAPTPTPEQKARNEARYHWAEDIRRKVSACERPLWSPERSAWLESAKQAAEQAQVREKQAKVMEARRNAWIDLTASAIIPPLILLLIGAALVAIWRRFLRVHWLELPQHIRTGVLRLYAVVAVPWIAWFGYRLFDALQRHNERLASSAFWWLLIVPIGAPIVLAATLWVIAGFRKRSMNTLKN